MGVGMWCMGWGGEYAVERRGLSDSWLIGDIQGLQHLSRAGDAVPRPVSRGTYGESGI